MLAKVWAVISSILAAVFAVLHFANPYPLVQVPDHGHRLYAVPAVHHNAIVELLHKSGLTPFGTFTAGVRQTLFRDGFTVIASGATLQKAAISIPCVDPTATAEASASWLVSKGIEAHIWTPDGDLKGKLVVLRLPSSFGWDIAYRLPGKDMPRPKWE